MPNIRKKAESDGHNMRPKGAPPAPLPAGLRDYKFVYAQKWLEDVSRAYPDIVWSVELYVTGVTFCGSRGPALIRRTVSWLEIDSAKMDIAVCAVMCMATELRR